ncbi:MAG: cytochrome C peroxidase [Chloroflexi bacterium]|nr:cytochrome C peroxidase [Chloroflexota bacterium]
MSNFSHHQRRSIALLALAFGVAAAATLLLRPKTSAQMAELDPIKVRAAAQAIGLDSLHNVVLLDPPELVSFINSGPAASRALVQLGKALFWDQQVGSDGQACGSCHFSAGADPRVKNQLSPQLRNSSPEEASRFNPTGSGNPGGPNYALAPQDFPFHKLSDPAEENFKKRVETFDTDDAAASQGVFNARFTGSAPGQLNDNGTRVADPVFSVGGVNVRRVEPRNTPTVINAAFNFHNFWDGRAHNAFNGMNPIGPLADFPLVWVNQGGDLQQVTVTVSNSSLASQAVGPPLSTEEMSYAGRTFRDIGRKMLDGRTPLAYQLVSLDDSVFGELSRFPDNGLNATYENLIRTAFASQFWQAPLDPLTGQPLPIDGYTLMESNFPLFFGLSVQMYEFTLIADRTPFDLFMEGDNNALTQDQLRGLLMFIKTETHFQEIDPLFNGINDGNCVFCHGGPELTNASLRGGGALEMPLMAELVNGRLVRQGNKSSLEDEGFANIGVRPTREDRGRGGFENGKPLSGAKQAFFRFAFGPKMPPGKPAPDPFRTNDEGSFKIPGLRNVELTGPYFHNGGQLTLSQVIDFYTRAGDFSDRNIRHLDPNMAGDLILIKPEDNRFLVKFLLSLTDERVRQEMAPFDHPQIRVPNGHPGDNSRILSFTTADGVNQADDDLLVIPAVGRGGRPQGGLPPLQPFLNADHLAP